jgi:lysozyme family protein
MGDVKLTYPQTFILAMNLLLQHEGAVFVDHPDDSGGATKFGITAASYDKHFGRAATPDAIKALTLDQAFEFYYVEYWQELGVGALDEKLAVIIFNQAVNCGITAVTKRIQGLLDLPVDGKLGPMTLGKLTAVNPKSFGVDFLHASALAYINSAQARPKNMRFLNGWINRIFSLLDFFLESRDIS